MRFSLRWLLGIVAFAAVACLSLIYASDMVSNFLFAVLYLFLGLSVLGILYRQHEARAFWGGCAILGSLYFACGFLPNTVHDVPLPWKVTDSLIVRLYFRLRREVAVEEKVAAASEPSRVVRRKGVSYLKVPDFKAFMSAGHALVAFGLACSGAIVARRFHTIKERHIVTGKGDAND